MTISHHSHSGQFCLHAQGTLQEVIEEAIRKGFKTFGLSEHVPRYSSKHLYPEELEAKVTPRDLEANFKNYLIEANRLKMVYKDEIQLLVGLETEFIDQESLVKLEQLLETHRDELDYIVGSVHHCDELPIDFDKQGFDKVLSLQEPSSLSSSTESTSTSVSPTEEEEEESSSRRTRFERLFSKYFDQQYELIKRLKPEVIGHFDLIRLYYPNMSFKSEFPETVWKKIERNIETAVEYGALFELNSSAFRKGWKTGYPGVDVFDVSSAPIYLLLWEHSLGSIDWNSFLFLLGYTRKRR